MAYLHRRLNLLEKRQVPAATGQMIERFEVDGTQYVQIFWDNKPSGVWFADLWDAWDEPADFDKETK